MFKSKLLGTALVSLVCILGTSGCSSHTQTSLMAANAIQRTPLRSDLPSANIALSPTTSSIQVTMRLNRAALFNQEFIYQADLQYSNQYDRVFDLYTQSSAIGAWPASFRISGNELQLIANTRYKYPSDVNHPEQLLSTYEILSQDVDTITVSAANSLTFLAMQLVPGDASSTPPRNLTVLDHWVRSVDFVPQGSYLLQQTSVQLADSTVYEIMESVFPRSTLAPGKDFKMFRMSPTSLTGADSQTPGEVSRFRMLPGDTVFTGEDKHAWAQHFDLSPAADGTPTMIEWYVTPNIPDQYLEPVKEAVEGWNRYFRAFAGFKRDVLKFNGRLPKNVYLGDPRYNVINWDSRLVAGAAYESQDTDPENGKQSHSMIYMPAAWLQIGTTYWNLGIASDASKSVGAFLSGARVSSPFASRISCAEDVGEAAEAMASGSVPADAIQTFGVQLLKQTLFHEVGHSLGLAHNFKAYTSWDPSKPGTSFSTSIMAYNDYELERAAFSAVDSAEGPLLEYDRQALSAIYDGGKDIQTSDPVLPTCADAEADNQAGGVDPLCIRYANEWDPTLSLQDAYSRITQPTQPHDVTLVQALARVPSLSLSNDKIASIETDADLRAAIKAFGAQLKGSMTFYIVSGKRSLDYTMRLNMKSLYEFADAVPPNYDEQGMRERAFAAVLESVNMMALPDLVVSAANNAMTDGLNRIAKSPLLLSMSSADRDATVSKLKTKLSNTIASFNMDAANGLPKLRLAVLGVMSRQPAVPFFLGQVQNSSGTAQLDFETSVVGVLSDVISKKDPARLSDERVAAAKALATFKDRLPGKQAIAALTPSLTTERATASTNDARDTIEAIVSALGIN